MDVICPKCGEVRTLPFDVPENRLSEIPCTSQACLATALTPKASADTALASPDLLRRVANFAKAIFSQVALSAEALLSDEELKVTRSPEEIKAIAAICKACPLFDGRICTHNDCGCPIDEERAAWWSKLAWKSQKCPDGRWE